MTPSDLEAIARRQNLVVAVWQETEGENTAHEVGPLVCQDVPALLAEVRRLQTENRLLEAECDNLRNRVDGLLRDLDRDKEYWSRFDSE